MFHDYPETTKFNEMMAIHKVREKLTETDIILCCQYDVEMPSPLYLGFYSFSFFSQYL
ncbi:MAG: hypothetical protein NPIRA04_29580 [Nitrospirales bacterium]|nr:MAG: hypothetical protein NPIRA04_29580 [Nitrospirales bacterium]